jgi:hypothetical protein
MAKPRVARRVALTRSEFLYLEAAAARAGMSLEPFIEAIPRLFALAEEPIERKGWDSNPRKHISASPDFESAFNGSWLVTPNRRFDGRPSAATKLAPPFCRMANRVKIEPTSR